MAESSVHGILVAPRTRTPSLSFPTPAIIEDSYDLDRCFSVDHTLRSEVAVRLGAPSYSPCICTRNSVLIRRAASLSFSLLEPHRESISSMKMMDGLCSLAKENRFFTNLVGRVWTEVE